jgi:hypothetical protein
MREVDFETARKAHSRLGWVENRERKQEIVEFQGQGLVADEFEALNDMITTNRIGPLDDVVSELNTARPLYQNPNKSKLDANQYLPKKTFIPEPGPEDVVIENGHVVEIRSDALGYGDKPTWVLKQYFPHLRKIRVSMLYDVYTNDAGMAAGDFTGVGSRVLRLDVPPDLIRTVTVEDDGVTFEFQTALPKDEEEISKLITRVPMKETFRSGDYGIPLRSVKYKHQIPWCSAYMGNYPKFAALVEKAIEENDTELWRRIRETTFVPQKDRLRGELFEKGMSAEPSVLKLEQLIDKAESYFNPSKDYRESIVDTLLKEGFHEQYAFAVASLFEENLQGGSTIDVKSKNQAYYVQVGDKIRVVKFSSNWDETNHESLSNYHYSRNPILRNHTSLTDMLEPVEIDVDGKKMYMTVQDAKPDSAMPTNPEQFKAYLHNWMKVLARFHVYATVIMDQLGNHQRATSFSRECYKERLKLSPARHDKGLLEDVLASGIEYGYGVAHNDTKLANRRGYSLIDWGNSGRGNQLFDIVKMFAEAYIRDIMGRDLNERDYRELLGTYMAEKRLCIGTLNEKQQQFYTEALNANDDSETTYQKFKIARAFMLSNIEAQLYAKGDPAEQRTREMIAAEVPDLQATMRRGVNKYKGKLVTIDNPIGKVAKEERPDTVIYYIKPRSDLKAA